MCYNGVCDLLVVPTKDFNLDQIPAGPNPRDLDPKSSKIGNITNSFLAEDNKFIIKNGGLQVIIDNDSFVINEDEGYVEFSCNDSNLTGHYDGQHTQYAVTQAINNSQKNALDSVVRVTLIESKLFDGILEIRNAANCWNARTKQKLTSENNILGVFDIIKKKIDTQFIDNVGFKQNQLNSKGVRILPETEVQQVIRLLATLFPLTYVDGLGVEELATHAKGAESKAMKLVKDEKYATYTVAAVEHVNYVIELSDFIQKNLEAVLGHTLFNQFDMVKKTSKLQLEKVASDRKHYSQQIFTGEFITGALDKDWTPMFVHSVVKNCFEWNGITGKFDMIYDVEQAKAIWMEGGAEVLKLMNKLFVNKFVTEFHTRRADFANQPQKWNQISDMIAKTIRKRDWRDRVQTTLKSAA